MRLGRCVVGAFAAMSMLLVGAPAGAQVVTEPLFRGIDDALERDRLDRCDLVGTEGDDVLRPGPGELVVCALGGDDVIFGNGEANWVLAGPGNDTVYGGGGDDLILVGSGDNVAYGGEGDDRIMVSFFGDPDSFDGAGVNRFIGGAGDDELAGGVGLDEQYTPLPSPGSLFVGGPGVDRLIGTGGPDRMYAGGQGGYVNGAAGDDFIVGGNGASGDLVGLWCLTGSDARRVIESPLSAVEGFAPFAAANVLVGGLGDDTIVSGGGRSCIAGSDGSDVIYGSEFDDSVFSGGRPGPPTNTPVPGGTPDDADFVFTKGGDDVIYGSAGSDTVYGGPGDDVFLDDRRSDGFTELPGDQLRPDLVRLGAGDDLIQGSAGDDELDGGPGSDTIFGGGGDDWLWPGRDADVDVLDGQAGKDGCGVFVYDAATCEHVSERS